LIVAKSFSIQNELAGNLRPSLKGSGMAARVIHYGLDECHRLRILRNAGYAVDDCHSLPQLREALSTDGGAEAVFITEEIGYLPEAAVSLTKSSSRAPLVLFRCSTGEYEEEKFDLVVESLTPPQQWLSEVETLILHSQGVRAQSQLISMQSALLRRESAAMRERSSAERERSRLECVRNAATGYGSLPKPSKD
jgi:hypothetical protein